MSSCTLHFLPFCNYGKIIQSYKCEHVVYNTLKNVKWQIGEQRQVSVMGWYREELWMKVQERVGSLLGFFFKK